MTKVNLKLKFRKGNYLPGSYDVGRLQNDNLRETFQDQLNTKLASLKVDNLEEGCSNFRKTMCEAAEGALGKQVRKLARTIV